MHSAIRMRGMAGVSDWVRPVLRTPLPRFAGEVYGRDRPGGTRMEGRTIRITSIEAAPLIGDTPKGGWDAEIKPEDSIHGLIAVYTDAGITGHGSVYTDGRLVQAGLRVLEPLFRDENALEPQRVSEKLHQNTFWMGRGGTLTHVISGIDIALWDILGQATSQPIGRLLGGCYRDRIKPYGSLLFDEPDALRRK